MSTTTTTTNTTTTPTTVLNQYKGCFYNGQFSIFFGRLVRDVKAGDKQATVALNGISKNIDSTFIDFDLKVNNDLDKGAAVYIVGGLKVTDDVSNNLKASGKIVSLENGVTPNGVLKYSSKSGNESWLSIIEGEIVSSPQKVEYNGNTYHTVTLDNGMVVKVFPKDGATPILPYLEIGKKISVIGVKKGNWVDSWRITLGGGKTSAPTPGEVPVEGTAPAPAVDEVDLDDLPF